MFFQLAAEKIRLCYNKTAKNKKGGYEMKVIVVLGSPRENGNSTVLAREVLRGAKEAGNETVVYDIDKMDVRGCCGCNFCRENSADCRRKDDLQRYWKDLHECGALIVSSPNYYSQAVGPMITFMNRHYCLTDAKGEKRLEPGKKIVGVFAQGNSDAEAYRKQYEWYLSVFEKCGMKRAGLLVSAGTEPVSSDCELMHRAFQLGKSL